MGALAREIGIFLLASSYIWVPLLVYALVMWIRKERGHREHIRRLMAARKDGNVV